jgi:hypothetical protein
MYRYSVDNAVTYTPSDFKLFRESPFAIWMERLTLENPDHGILPDVNTTPPQDDASSQDDLVETLREEGRDVVLVAWDKPESERRADTLHAMRSGADFIVNGVLALGPLCGTANLLMRTSGFSDFGDHLYVPCDTQERSTLDATFRLCFLADMLHSLQGQLPPQMLLVRGAAEVIPLQTEDHIYYYRAVKMRFMEAMRSYRKHRMPDPSESSHFGRWSDCAAEVLKQRAVSSDYQRYQEEWDERDAQSLDEQDTLEENQSVAVEPVVAQGAAQAGNAASSQSAGSAAIPTIGGVVAPLHDYAGRDAGSATLADRALQLTPGAFQGGAIPGHTPNLARFPKRMKPQRKNSSDEEVKDEVKVEVLPSEQNLTSPEDVSAITAPAEKAGEFRETLEDALQNLAFIGSSLSAKRKPEPADKPGGKPTAHSAQDDTTLEFGSADAEVSDIDALALDSADSLAATPGEVDAAPVAEGAVDEVLVTEEINPLEQISVEALDAPAPNLRELVHPEPKIEGYEVELIDLESLELEPKEPLLLPPDNVVEELQELERWAREESKPVEPGEESLVDLDSAPPPNLAPLGCSGADPEAATHLEQSSAEEQADNTSRREMQEALEKTRETRRTVSKQASAEERAQNSVKNSAEEEQPATSIPEFSSSLITNTKFREKD